MDPFVFGYVSSIEILDAVGFTAERSLSPQGKRPMEMDGLLVWNDLAAPHSVRDKTIPHPIPHLPLPVHAVVAVGAKTRATAAMVPHAWTCFNPIGDLVRMPGGDRPTYVCPVELALVQLASQGGRADIASYANQVTGTYRIIRPAAIEAYQGIPGVHVELYPKGSTPETCLSATAYDVPPLTTVERIRAYTDAFPGARGVRQLRRALPLLCDGLASPLEERIYVLAFCSRRMGSLGLPKPLVNDPMAPGDKARRFLRQDHITPDFRWAERGVVLEALGWRYHGRPGDIVDTSLREKAYRAMGIACITLTDAEVRNPNHFEGAMAELAGYLGTELPPETKAFRKQRARLRSGVLGYSKPKRPASVEDAPAPVTDQGYLDQLYSYADASVKPEDKDAPGDGC